MQSTIINADIKAHFYIFELMRINL